MTRNLIDVPLTHHVKPLPIEEIGKKLDLLPDDLTLYGRDKAKIALSVLQRPRLRAKKPKLILVSAMTPTPAGEGKTTTTIGLGQAMAQLEASVCLALREPSLGPCMGMKGGATGGGYSQVIPADSINLHFTGDFHAITSAHNLLAAMIDHHIYAGNALHIEPRRVVWRRVLDMNDRALREMIIGLGGVTQGIPRETGFDITAASEIMAILCLAHDIDDLRARIDRCLVAFDTDGKPVLAKQIGVTGAMMALLRDALMPNLVQTLEGTPALIHGGPFANIAHGCNSVLATRMAMHLADWTLTEAGFGFDLGGEKFFDLKCQSAHLDVDAVVLVATIRALKMHGGRKLDELQNPDPHAVLLGLSNLEKQIENVHVFRKRPIVALNRFLHDTHEEIEGVRTFCQARDIPFAVTTHYAEGGKGALALAHVVMEEAQKESPALVPLYPMTDSPEDKILAVAQKMYGAHRVVWTKTALHDLHDIRTYGYDHLPVCVAKTQNSLSDDPHVHGRPNAFEVAVQHIQVSAGAGFLVVLMGDILRMPGLPRTPHAQHIDLIDGVIVGLS